MGEGRPDTVGFPPTGEGFFQVGGATMGFEVFEAGGVTLL
jgi:hypothetical protein